MSTGRAVAPVLALILAVGLGVRVARPEAPRPLLVARDGQSALQVILVDDPHPAERTAAVELVAYLERITGTRLPIVGEGQPGAHGPAIHIGPTRVARQMRGGTEPDLPERWVVRTAGRQLLLHGGSPRGTLYAVYHFLEDRLGVRWWTPFDEDVPSLPELKLPPLDETGTPAFVYRDIHGVPGPRAFLARLRLNGHAARLPETLGGSERYGPPKQVHNFFLYAPPEELFDSHPEFFSEIGGLRYAERTQLCLTNPELQRLVAERLVEHVESARQAAADAGETAPRLFNVSQNDWGSPCTCDRCRSLVEREGSRAAPVIAFINEIAGTIGPRFPDVWLDTLAYGWSYDPPRSLAPAANVVLRWSALYARDFAKSLDDQGNAEVARVLEDWAQRTPHLRVWDYAVTFGPGGDLPRGNTAFLDTDLRRYRQAGVEGLFVQQDPHLAADLADLKLWVMGKLLEDPRRDGRTLIEIFARGYYGPAADPLLDYVERLEQATAKFGGRIRFDASPEAFSYLDGAFLRDGQRRFDAAEARVADDPVKLRRVRDARRSLDRATLKRRAWLRPAELEELGELDLDAVAERYRSSCYAQIELRLPEGARAAARDAVDEEIEELRP